jgi:hypothetical protein
VDAAAQLPELASSADLVLPVMHVVGVHVSTTVAHEKLFAQRQYLKVSGDLAAGSSTTPVHLWISQASEKDAAADPVMALVVVPPKPTACVFRRHAALHVPCWCSLFLIMRP